MSKQVILKNREERRILAGHQWVFSNEVKETRGEPQSGDVVEILRHDQRFLGLGFYHPHSLIAVRFLTSLREEVSFEFFRARISRAWDIRRRLFPDADAFRLVHGESDFLPGLVVDKFGDHLSLQTFSAGMDRRLTLVGDVLESLFHPRAMVERNESTTRGLEGLPARTGPIRGEARPTTIDEHGIRYVVDTLEGQKTGFFLDQRENRRAIHRYVRGRRVLDCFCSDGGFALNAVAGGAAGVIGVDIAKDAVDRGSANARLNGFDTVRFHQEDIFEMLKRMVTSGDRFGVVILDPPSFTKSRKNVNTALRGYKEINAGALRLVEPDGFLITSSCSHHVDRDDFLGVLEESAVRAGRKVQLLELTGASPDHPVLPAMPETSYLKFAILSVS